MKIQTKISNLQMHKNLHKNVNHIFMQIFMNFYDRQLKQQIYYSFTILISYIHGLYQHSALSPAPLDLKSRTLLLSHCTPGFA